MDHIDTLERFGDMRTESRFAWLPVLLTGEPWFRRASWVHLDWYEAHDVFEPDHGGWKTGNWVEIEAHRVTTHA